MSAWNSRIDRSEFPGHSRRRGLDPALLQTEIDFWRSLIEAQHKPSRSRESTERMQQALALAEYRLAEISSNRYTVVT